MLLRHVTSACRIQTFIGVALWWQCSFSKALLLRWSFLLYCRFCCLLFCEMIFCNNICSFVFFLLWQFSTTTKMHTCYASFVCLCFVHLLRTRTLRNQKLPRLTPLSNVSIPSTYISVAFKSKFTEFMEVFSFTLQTLGWREASWAIFRRNTCLASETERDEARWSDF